MVCDSRYNSVMRVADPTIALGNGCGISRTKLLSKYRLLTLRRRKVMKLSAEQKFCPFPPNCLSMNYKVLLQCRECERCEPVAGTLLFESSQIGFLGMKFHKFLQQEDVGILNLDFNYLPKIRGPESADVKRTNAATFDRDGKKYFKMFYRKL